MDDENKASSHVGIKVSRLYEIIKASIQDGLEDEILRRYGEQEVILTDTQAALFKNFVRNDIADTEGPGFDEGVGPFSHRRAKPVGRRLRAALPGDCGHCRPRR